jgi:hypothetical protein
VVPDPTATTLSESTTTVTYGHESVEHFSVHVGAGSGWTPYGAVTIRTGPVVLCRIILSSAKGACSPAEKALPPNRYEIEAVYAGNADFAPSTSAASRMTVRS